MHISTPEERWLHIGLDDDGTAVFIDPRSVKTHGLRLDRVDVTVIVKPVEKSDGLRAIQELLLKANKAQEDVVYVEQSWVLHLPRRLFSVRNLTVKNREDVALHSVPLSSIDLSTIEPGSVADQVSQAVEKLVQDQSVVLQRPDASPAWEPTRPRMSPPLRSEPDTSGSGIPGDQPEAIPRLMHRLSFLGSGLNLFVIQVVNMFLTLVTFGFYSLWGRVRVRKYLMRETEFGGDRFEFHGTGKELLRGWTKATIVFGLPLILLPYIPYLTGSGVGIKQAVNVLSSLIVFVFIPVAMVGARRYRLSRTSWREIRFSFRGRTWSFVKLYLAGSALTVITLGLYKPFLDTRAYGFMVSHAYFGNRVFRFDGEGRDLFRPFFLAWLLTIPTLGIYWFWYWAQRQRYLWEHTSFGALRFRSTVTGGALVRLHVVNLILLVVTLGFAWSWVKVRKIRFLFEYLRVRGEFDPESIIQEAQAASPTGEALAGFFDMDFDLG